MAVRAPAVAAVFSGALAGAMLLIRLVLVPFWRAASPAEFRSWFAVHSPQLRALMLPLGIGAASTSALAAVTARGRGPAPFVSALSSAGVVAITVTVNEPANERFVQPDLSDEETTELLGRWARWHDVRVLLGVAGACAAAATLARR